MLDAVVGLGSNLGDRRDYLARAARRIGELGRLVAFSALYETDPVGPPQPIFLNAAVRLRTALGPEQLLDGLLEIERSLGRARRERWGPRVIDLDLLWLAGLSINAEKLVVPHAELRSRRFALAPLLDVAPEATDPKDGTSYARVSATLDSTSVRELPGTRGVWA